MKRQAKKRPQKVYVKVSADSDCMGRLHPRSIIWGDGRVFNIDSVTDYYPGYISDHCEDRYTIVIKGETRYLFFERNDEYIGSIVGRLLYLPTI